MPYIAVKYYNVGVDLLTPNIDTLWNRTNYGSNYSVGSGQGNKYGYLGSLTDTVKSVFTAVSNPAFINSFKNSLTADKFILGIASAMENNEYFWNVTNSTVTIRVVFSPPQQSVFVDQRLIGNSSVDSVGVWNIGQNKFDKFQAPQTFDWELTSTKVLQSSQKLINNQKYQNWVGVNDVTNHQPFTITPTTNQILSQFDSTQSGVTIKNNLEQTAVTGGSIDFKDPWLIDYADPAYGSSMRNRGMDVPFKPRTAPFYPDATTSYSGDVYKGVFLDQGGTGFTPPYYSVKAQQTQNINLGSPWGTRAFYFQNWSGTNVNYQDSTLLETPLVFTNDNAVATANYKGHLLSNNSTGFSSNSQSKFISQPYSSNRHLVYDSQGSVWYTKSTDNGTTWQQEVKLNEDGTQAKGATFAYSSGDGYMYILYQCDHGTWGNPNPTLILSQYFYGTLRWQEEVCQLSSYSFNTMAVVAAMNNIVMVVYKPTATSGLVGKEYLLNSGNIALTYDRIIPSTNQSCVNPSLAISETTQPIKYMLVYEQSGIQYREWTVTTDFLGSATSPISFGAGNSFNNNPTIIEYNGAAKIAWIGSRKINGAYQNRTVYRERSVNGNLSVFSNFGSDVSSPTISKKDDNTAFVLGWSENNGVDNCFTDEYLSLIFHLNTTGKDLQLSNGIDKNSMYGMSFNNSGMPYFLTQSNNIQSFYSISKANSLGINKGREGVVAKGSGEFYFTIGDVNVNGENTSFKTLPDSFAVTSVNDINNYVRTTSFALSDNSQFSYSVQYGITDSAEIVNSLSVNDVVSFRVELVDEATNVVLGLFDNVSFTKQQAVPYENISYQVATEGIGNRMVYLRLVTTATEGFSFSLANLLDNQYVLAKRNMKEISYKSTAVIKDYALAQNYPNPFNPVTTITYQLPKSGSVTLKIFDILGNEVKTLVDEQKEMGRYTVQFDASSLASGMYVYQLRANDYTSTKKMMLLK